MRSCSVSTGESVARRSAGSVAPKWTPRVTHSSSCSAAHRTRRRPPLTHKMVSRRSRNVRRASSTPCRNGRHWLRRRTRGGAPPFREVADNVTKSPGEIVMSSGVDGATGRSATNPRSERHHPCTASPRPRDRPYCSRGHRNPLRTRRSRSGRRISPPAHRTSSTRSSTTGPKLRSRTTAGWWRRVRSRRSIRPPRREQPPRLPGRTSSREAPQQGHVNDIDPASGQLDHTLGHQLLQHLVRGGTRRSGHRR